MKLAISMTGESLDAPFDARFGRAAQFCLVEPESGVCELVANPARDASGGAGVQAAQLLASQGVTAVVSGAYGPKAWKTLHAAGIRALLAPDSAHTPTGREMLEQFCAGTLREADAASHDGHHGS